MGNFIQKIALVMALITCMVLASCGPLAGETELDQLIKDEVLNHVGSHVRDEIAKKKFRALSQLPGWDVARFTESEGHYQYYIQIDCFHPQDKNNPNAILLRKEIQADALNTKVDFRDIRDYGYNGAIITKASVYVNDADKYRVSWHTVATATATEGEGVTIIMELAAGGGVYRCTWFFTSPELVQLLKSNEIPSDVEQPQAED